MTDVHNDPPLSDEHRFVVTQMTTFLPGRLHGSGTSKLEDKFVKALKAQTVVPSPIIGGHKLPHGLPDVHGLNVLGLQAVIAGPHGGGLSCQQTVGTFGHPRALSVEPFLTGGFAQNGVLVVVDLVAARSAGIDESRRGLVPGVPGGFAGWWDVVDLGRAAVPPRGAVRGEGLLVAVDGRRRAHVLLLVEGVTGRV